jgi:hypothetical protein
MTATIHIIATILVALAAALSVAHALEYPGKMRLGREQYFAVQQIYYPGFTIGGAAEPLGTIVIVALLFLLPFGGTQFWLAVVALIAMLGVMAVFWMVTQPANKLWTQDLHMGSAGKNFFQTGAGDPANAHWTAVRDRWERSHITRAFLASVGFVCLLIALAIRP